MKVTQTREIEIDDQRVNDLLCGAFEGGSNYWIERVGKRLPAGETAEYLHDVPFKGGTLIIHEAEVEDDVEPIEIDYYSLEEGLAAMAEAHPWHFQNFLDENDDAETSDVFLQMCCFGELVYG